jgi:hypothetical protein
MSNSSEGERVYESQQEAQRETTMLQLHERHPVKFLREENERKEAKFNEDFTKCMRRFKDLEKEDAAITKKIRERLNKLELRFNLSTNAISSEGTNNVFIRMIHRETMRKYNIRLRKIEMKTQNAIIQSMIEQLEAKRKFLCSDLQ